MNKNALNTPVLLLIFSRPDTTQLVFNEVRKARPKRLFVAADGPREGKGDEPEKCRMARDVIRLVDWDCEVKTLFREKNLGCKVAVSSAIDWFFENVEEGIVLEDDTVPHPTFFRFCDELLERYRNDERVMTISGDNFQFGRKRTEYSYYFSIFNHCWGWASWKRAWKYYDIEMKLWPYIRGNGRLMDILQNKKAVAYWTHFFESVYTEKVNSWAVRWTFACWVQSGLSILPHVNLVSNIGFDSDATHTSNVKNKYSNMQTAPTSFPLKHPPYLIRDVKADEFTQQNHFGDISLSLKLFKKTVKAFRKYF